ncbi:hypothetical protein [Sphingomonas sp.]|uniref:hypothetical protein n=1 Tax=Sphingomonas sp. TaxID=28214 RepID=UPI0025DA8E7B|nr:hypothetical protein [Sphingomonas sp.]MBV9526995.1 hypothetical protein [Sphingomonas sp.]MBV9842254.1 hypothetical protein [Sphingomonadaceae bacterium]
MFVIGLLGAVCATAALTMFIVRLAEIALPCWVGLVSLFAALHCDVDPLLAIAIALLLGALTLIAGRAAFAQNRSLGLRAAVAAVFVIPAAIAGYHVAGGIVSLTSGSQLARLVAGAGGAIGVGWASLQHLIGGASTLGKPTRLADLAGLNRVDGTPRWPAAATQERGHLS